MPIYQYGEQKIHYTREGQGKPIVFLHGWGANLDSFNVLTKELSMFYEIVALDFPGFGESEEPRSPWSLDDYTAMTRAFIEHLDINKPTLVGHSFGGRVSIKLSQLLDLDKIILINSAGIKPKRKMSYYFRVYGYKTFKTIAGMPLFRWILKEPLEAYREIYSSADYKQASSTMKQVLSKVVNEDLRHLLKKIAVPVLLIWGDKDTSTPVEDAKLMEEMIPDAGLVIYEGVGHFSYLEQPAKTVSIIKTFVGGI